MITTTLVLLVFGVLLLFQAAVPEDINIKQAEFLVTTIIGGVLSFGITQLTKKGVNLQGRTANIVSFVVAVAVAAGTLWFTGELEGKNLLAGVGGVYTLANLIYRQVAAREPERDEPGDDPVSEKLD
jgi:hypothetical protein